MYMYKLDPAAVIGFLDSNIPVMIAEGGPSQMVNIEVNQDGLPLDATDTVQIDVQICLGKMPHLAYYLENQKALCEATSS